MTNREWYDIIAPLQQATQVETSNAKKCGGIAQLARATGSYPVGRGFKSNFRYHKEFISAAGPMVKRLRHRPFTAVTGVRFSLGSPRTLIDSFKARWSRG